jgi:hypothetical protein
MKLVCKLYAYWHLTVVDVTRVCEVLHDRHVKKFLLLFSSCRCWTAGTKNFAL